MDNERTCLKGATAKRQQANQCNTNRNQNMCRQSGDAKMAIKTMTGLCPANVAARRCAKRNAHKDKRVQFYSLQLLLQHQSPPSFTIFPMQKSIFNHAVPAISSEIKRDGI